MKAKFEFFKNSITPPAHYTHLYNYGSERTTTSYVVQLHLLYSSDWNDELSGGDRKICLLWLLERTHTVSGFPLFVSLDFRYLKVDIQ